MTFSGDQNGGLARYLPGCTAGWREEAQKWGVNNIQGAILDACALK